MQKVRAEHKWALAACKDEVKTDLLKASSFVKGENSPHSCVSLSNTKNST